MNLMNKHPLPLFFLVPWLAASCTQDLPAFESSLVGVWAGEDPSGLFAWCYRFDEDGALGLKTAQKNFGDAEGEWVRTTRYEGSWSVALGKRINIDLDRVNKQEVNHPDNDKPLSNLRIPNTYYVAEIGPQAFRANNNSRGEGSWIEGRRVDRCPVIEIDLL